MLHRVNHNLGIRRGTERCPVVPNEFLAQFAVVVDLAVEDNRVTTAGGRERLVTAGQINNRQTAKSKSYLAIGKAPGIVRSPVAHCVHHR